MYIQNFVQIKSYKKDKSWKQIYLVSEILWTVIHVCIIVMLYIPWCSLILCIELIVHACMHMCLLHWVLFFSSMYWKQTSSPLKCVNNLKLKLVSIIQINKKQLFFIFLFIHFFVQYTGISFYTDFVVTNNTYLFSNFFAKNILQIHLWVLF